MNRLQSFDAARKSRGFSIIELMVGMAVGLIATVVVAQVLTFSEGQKRSTTSGGDAQISGALALYTIQRDLEMAGYGFSSSRTLLGCALSATFNGAAPVGFPAILAPVVIEQGLNGAPDTIRVLSSSKTSYSVPTSVIAPGYVPTDQIAGGRAFSFPVVSPLGITGGDLLVAVLDAATPCGVFQATADAAAGSVPRADVAGGWNANGEPVTPYGNGSVLVNLGQVTFRSYSIGGTNLRLESLATATNSTSVVDLQANVVTLKAMYGKDTIGDDGVIDVYDNTTPVNNTQWQQVRAIRIAVVTRSTQFEKQAVISANPQWDVGIAATVAGADCTSGKCFLSLKVDGAADWGRYRYKIFDTVVPLRNMLWQG